MTYKKKCNGHLLNIRNQTKEIKREREERKKIQWAHACMSVLSILDDFNLYKVWCLIE